MYSKKFSHFIEIWQKDFAIERSIDEGICLDKNDNPLPWYTYPAIEYLAQFEYADKCVFEYGCGYSSLFWAERAEKVVGVEDNRQWFNKWLQFDHPHLELMLREDKQDYCAAIDEKGEKYDVIAIDGKYRADCVRFAIGRLNKGGLIILDDSDRINTSSEYVEAIRTLRKEGLLQVDFYGFCPINNYPKTTSIFFCRDFDFPTKNAVQPINGIGNLWGRGRRARKIFYKDNC